MTIDDLFTDCVKCTIDFNTVLQVLKSGEKSRRAGARREPCWEAWEAEAGKPGSREARKPGSRKPWKPSEAEAGKPGCQA